MYRLLIVTTNQATKDMLASMEGWEALGVKPPRVLSTDEPGGLPDLVRQALGDPKADVRTVHRLDRVVSGFR